MKALVVALALAAALAAATVEAQRQQPANNKNHGGGGGGGGLGTTPVAVEGSALLITYYAGATWALQKGGVIVPGKTRISGLSGGGYTAVLNTLGWTGPEQKALWHDAIMKNRDIGKSGYLNEIMYTKLEEKLPDNVARRITGLVRIALSQLDAAKKTFKDSASWIISSFADKRDVIAALVTTDMIPCFAALSTYGIFRNQPIIDGGYGNGFQQLCPSGNTDNCIKLASWVVGDKAIHDCTTDPPYNCAAKFVAKGCKADDREEPIRTRLYNNGKYVDRWPIAAVQGRCPEPNVDAGETLFEGQDPYPLPYFVPQDQVTPDIYPGKYNPLPEWQGQEMAACQWQGWALAPPTDEAELQEMLDVVYRQGYQDARSYLSEELGIDIDDDPN